MLAHASAVLATANSVADDARGAVVVSRCAVPRIATRAHARHECDNRLPTALNYRYIDICTGILNLDGLLNSDGDIAEYKRVDRRRPEWATQPTAQGPGMRGVLPWGCEHVLGAAPETVPLQPPIELASGVAALSVGYGGNSGKMVGSAILISPTVLLTARHVLYDEAWRDDPIELTHAIFRYFNSDIFAPPSHEALHTVRLVKNTDGYPKILAESRELDFALIKLEKSSGAVPISIPERGVSAGRAGPMVLGYTDNPFFPRGLVVSTHGDWQPVPPGLSGNDLARYDLFYNVNTANGFSGGPVLDTSHRLRGMHLRAFAGDDLRDSKKLMDFSRPNGGISVDAIFACIAAALTRGDLETLLRSESAAAAIYGYRKPTSGERSDGSSRCSDLVTRQETVPDGAIRLEADTANTKAHPPRRTFCEVYRAAAVEESMCSVDLAHDDAQRLLPEHLRGGYRPAIGALIAKDRQGRSMLMGTAVLISADLVVTAGHVVPIPDTVNTQQVRFVLGYNPENLLSAPPKKCAYESEVSRHILAASARSLRDFAVLRLKSTIDSSAMQECNWKLLRPRALPPTVNTNAFAIGHFNLGAERNLSLFYAGKFMGVNRWSKDGGGSVNVDYGLGTEPGLSGAAVFDEDFNWVALHQRTLSRASEETDTKWHPYGYWMYGDNRADCRGKRPNLSGVSLSDCWPAQGTLMSDIAIDTTRAMGIEWMCSELPTWISLLPSRGEFSCNKAGPAPADDSFRTGRPVGR